MPRMIEFSSYTFLNSSKGGTLRSDLKTAMRSPTLALGSRTEESSVPRSSIVLISVRSRAATNITLAKLTTFAASPSSVMAERSMMSVLMS